MPQLAQVLTEDQLTDADREPAPLPTVWTVPDDLWGRIVPILAALDPPAGRGRHRIDQRAALDTIVYRLRTGVQWNHLPTDYPDDSSVHRTMQRWVARGVFERIWAEVLTACEDLRGVDWEWQAVDGAMGKARKGGT